MLAALKSWAKGVRRDMIAVFLAARDPRTPWYAKLAAACVAAYALSPIDLIPDFIPVLGYADDLLIVPVGIWVAVRLLPAELMDEFRAEAAKIVARPTSPAGALLVVAAWLVAAGLLTWWLWPHRAS
jgi:uncharacterized membrane protein YkvA (DUF1232 family)